MQGHHGEGLSALHHPAQPLAHAPNLRLQEVVGHSAPDDWGQHLHDQPRGTLGHGVLAVAAEHGRRDGHDVLKASRQEEVLPKYKHKIREHFYGKKDRKNDNEEVPTFSLPSSNCSMFWLEGPANTAGKSLVFGSTYSKEPKHVR